MKIKVKIVSPPNYGDLSLGGIYEAEVETVKIKDSLGQIWYLAEHFVEVVKDTSPEPQGSAYSVHQLLGQDIKTIEFK